jgi:hypothetical protein
LEGYVKVVDTNLVRALANMPPTRVRQPMTHDGREPWHQRARRVVRRPHGMDRQQDFLDDVFNIRFAEESSPCSHELSDPRRNGSQQGDVGVAVALLGTRVMFHFSADPTITPPAHRS